MTRPHDFERYFHDRAERAEVLFRDGWRDEAYLIAIVVFDAIAAIWAHDSHRGALSKPRSVKWTSSLLFQEVLELLIVRADPHVFFSTELYLSYSTP